MKVKGEPCLQDRGEMAHESESLPGAAVAALGKIGAQAAGRTPQAVSTDGWQRERK